MLENDDRGMPVAKVDWITFIFGTIFQLAFLFMIVLAFWKAFDFIRPYL